MRISKAALSVIFAMSGGAIALAAMALSSFQGAGPGAAVSFQTVALPPVSSGSGGAGLGIPAMFFSSPFLPTRDSLLNGEIVITSDTQMKAVWKLLFATPYDPTLFDFQSTFVVLMGGGLLPSGASFDISHVESVIASYTDLGGHGGAADEPFLSVTSTTFFPGVQQKNPPPPSYHVAAARFAKSLLDDVVFHRAQVFGV